MKFTLGDASKKKWNIIRPHAATVLDECLQGWPDKEEVVNNASRWEPPAITTQVECACSKAQVHKLNNNQVLKAADVWAASMNSQWFKKCEALKHLLVAKGSGAAGIAFSIGNLPPVHGDRV